MKDKMKTVTFEYLKINNFRQMGSREMSFSEHSCIIGRNGSGKTNTFHAITWCLFGKDLDDRSKFDTVPLNPDNTATETEPDVTLGLIIDGKQHELRRQLKGGKTAQTYIDKSPCKTLKEFDEFVAGIFGTPERFKMYTNPLYFPEIHWKEQRETFMQFFPTPESGAVCDYMDAKKIKIRTHMRPALLDAEPEKLIAKYELKVKDLDAEREKIRAQVELLDEQLDGNQLFDEADAQAERDQLREKIKGIQKEIQKAAERNSTIASEKQNLQTSIMRLERERDQEHERAKNDLATAISEKEYQIKQMERVKADLVEEYKSLRPVNDTCHTCGQKLQSDKIEALQRQLDQRRQDIAAEGQDIAKKINGAKQELEALKQADPTVDKKRIGELSKAIEQVELQLKSVQQPVEIPTIDEALTERLDELDQLCARSDVYRENNERRNALKERERAINKEYEEAQNFLHDLADFLFYRSEMIVKAVNSSFKNISVKVLEVQKNGNPKETFEILKNGVPYSELNTAGKFEAGLELTQFLKEKLKITCPVLIDNAERLTDVSFADIKGQLICGVAVKGAELAVINATPDQIDRETLEEK